MTIFEHLDELRTRLIIAGLGTAAGMIIALVFLTWPVMGLLSQPPSLFGQPVELKLVALRPTETFVTFMKVSLATGVALAMPVIVSQVLLFILPALHKHERRYLFIAIPFVTLAFAAGLAFSYFLVIPFAVRYLLGFGAPGIEAMWSIEEYLSFITALMFWIGVSFETPIVLFFLAKLGVVDVTTLGRYRKYALIGSFIIAAIITPTPDPVNQAIVAIPMYLLYELGILLARVA
jgi:sec-independent protein translocase protein TatC